MDTEYFPRRALGSPMWLSSLQQAKHDLLSSKYSAENVRQRLKYDSLAGRHMELQQEYEALLKDFKNQQRAARVARNAPKVTNGSSAIHLVSHPTQDMYWYIVDEGGER